MLLPRKLSDWWRSGRRPPAHTAAPPRPHARTHARLIGPPLRLAMAGWRCYRRRGPRSVQRYAAMILGYATGARRVRRCRLDPPIAYLELACATH
ncbi:unnamed protein product, partial [Iphiclides podalirius]